MRRCAQYLLLPLLLTACAYITPEERTARADTRAAAMDWHAVDIATDQLVLRAYVPVPIRQAEILTLYIEGDGQAYLSPSHPAQNPTPVEPIALRLALQHPRTQAAAYLARPCQYVTGGKRSGCGSALWTQRRFSEEVIDATDQATTRLMERYGAKRLVLVGYSGGGAVAALLAARRNDVERLITVAGNIDTTAWVSLHRLTPLTGSLNPANDWQRLQSIPQLHLVGGMDSVMPATIAKAYQARFPAGRQPQVRVVPGFDHHCCWVEHWPGLITQLQ